MPNLFGFLFADIEYGDQIEICDDWRTDAGMIELLKFCKIYLRTIVLCPKCGWAFDTGQDWSTAQGRQKPLKYIH
jgi:hypothetical protein